MYGRTRIARKADLTSTQLNVPQSDWEVLIRDTHVGYIECHEFEHNQVTLMQSVTNFCEGAQGVMLREGVGLLQGAHDMRHMRKAHARQISEGGQRTRVVLCLSWRGGTSCWQLVLVNTRSRRGHGDQCITAPDCRTSGH